MARDLIRLQAHADLQTLCELAIKWSEKSSNPEITELKEATARIINWTIYLEQQHGTFDAIINKSLDEKHKALDKLKELDKVKKELAIANAQLAKTVYS
jgi:hypothetical protein